MFYISNSDYNKELCLQGQEKYLKINFLFEIRTNSDFYGGEYDLGGFAKFTKRNIKEGSFKVKTIDFNQEYFRLVITDETALFDFYEGNDSTSTNNIIINKLQKFRINLINDSIIPFLKNNLEIFNISNDMLSIK